MDLLAPWRWLWARLPRVSVSFGARLHRSMASALAIAVYVGLGAAIIAAAVWYADAVLQRFFTVDPTPAIAPITVVGADEAVAKGYAAGLPTMIIAATNDLKLRANAAIRTLAEAKNELAQSPKPVEDVDLPVPSEFREELTVNLKIADVDVGPLLSFLLERARDPNVLRLTVALDADGKGSDVYGFLPGQAGYGFAARSSGDLPGIARAVAVQLVQRAAQGGESAFAALDATAFQATVEALEAYARLAFARRWITVAEGSAATGQDRLRGEYAEVLAKVKSTAQRYTGWEGLQWLAAQAAKEAGDWASALEFYGSLKRLAEVSANDPLLSRLTIAIQDAERRLAEQQAVIVAAARGEVPTSERKLTASVATGEAARRVLEAIGLTAPGTAAGVTIGILGAAPWDEAIANSPVEVLDGDMPTEAPNDLRDYQTTVWQAVRLVAPDAAFVFSPIPGGSTYAQTSALLIALKRLLDRRPDIVLVTFGSPRADPAIDAVIREAAPRALLVLAAGNEGGLSGYAGLADVAAVTSATGPAGAPAPFSSRAMPAIWAPGTDIPIISSATGRQDLRSGTTYAAAIASGAAALLRREHPQATAAQLREALLATSRPAEGRQEPAIINVPDAQSRLAAGG